MSTVTTESTLPSAPSERLLYPGLISLPNQSLKSLITLGMLTNATNFLKDIHLVGIENYLKLTKF